MAAYSGWADFDVAEYVERNYGRRILAEDAFIITAAVKALQQLRVPLRSLRLVADVGAGPNLYPAMLWSPFVADDGRIELLELAAANRQYAEACLGRSRAGIWRKFELFMASQAEPWAGTWQRLRQQAITLSGNIYDLAPEQYEAMSAFFVCESITDQWTEFERAVRNVVAAVQPGGLVMTAHMIGSTGWHAGTGLFPAVAIGVSDLHQLYDVLLDEPLIMPVTASLEVRPGYEGMALVIGRRRSA